MSIQNSPLVRKLGAYVSLSERGLEILTKFHKVRRIFSDKTEMVYEGQVVLLEK